MRTSYIHTASAERLDIDRARVWSCIGMTHVVTSSTLNAHRFAQHTGHGFLSNEQMHEVEPGFEVEPPPHLVRCTLSSLSYAE